MDCTKCAYYNKETQTCCNYYSDYVGLRVYQTMNCEKYEQKKEKTQ